MMELGPQDELNLDRGFFDLGMDSLMTVALKARLEERLGIHLPSTLAMDHPTVAALAGYLETEFMGNSQPSSAAVAATLTGMCPSANPEMDDLTDDQ